MFGRSTAFLALWVVECSAHVPLAAPAAPLTSPSRLCTVGEAAPSCLGALQVEELLAESAEIVGMADTPSGMQGAKILTLRSRADGRDIVFRAKWRPHSSAGLINEPRKELAGYAVQKLFLDEAEFVAPPTAAHCFPLDEYRRFAPDEPRTFDGIDCVFGFASYWLESAQTVSSARDRGLVDGDGGFWDARLFKADALYRHSVSSVNLLTYLINHGDAHTEQFMLEQTATGLRAYVVDNSISFRSIKNPMLFFREDWSEIQVPSLPLAALDRLRQLAPADICKLGTIAELERQKSGLVHVHRTREGAASQSDGSTMSWRGARLRIGLTSGEIEIVRSRVQTLLERLGLGRPIHED